MIQLYNCTLQKIINIYQPVNGNGGNVSQADDIREFIGKNYIQPARNKGESTVLVVSGDVHERMGLYDRMPNVCQVLDGRILQGRFNIQLIRRTGPKQSSTVEYTFQL